MTSAHNPFVEKLRRGASLAEHDEGLLRQAMRTTSRRPARVDLLQEGDPADSAFVVLEGLACRYKRLPHGKRQITSLLLPGDSCELHTSLRREADDSIATLTNCVLAVIPRKTVQDWARVSPAIADAIAWAARLDQAILREWLVNLGARTAIQRTAHLFCELHARSRVQNSTSESNFTLSLTQENLANLLGLSPVHVSRVLGRLRQADLMILKGREVTIYDERKLASIAGFDSGYLDLEV